MSVREEKLPGLYDPRFEHDNCGIGAVVNVKGVKSRQTVEQALHIVENLEHRAGRDAEGKTGDGVGIMLQISHKFFKKVTKPLGFELGEEREYGIGMFFFPQDMLARNQAMKMFEIIVKKEGLKFLGWREVPIHPELIGARAVEKMPCIVQGFVKKPAELEKGLPFDRRLYVVRRVFEQSNDNTYVVSLSSRTIVYKGMFLVKELRRFFPDLQDKDYEAAMAMVHSRFSTNTNKRMNEIAMESQPAIVAFPMPSAMAVTMPNQFSSASLKAAQKTKGTTSERTQPAILQTPLMKPTFEPTKHPMSRTAKNMTSKIQAIFYPPFH